MNFINYEVKKKKNSSFFFFLGLRRMEIKSIEGSNKKDHMRSRRIAAGAIHQTESKLFFINILPYN